MDVSLELIKSISRSSPTRIVLLVIDGTIASYIFKFVGVEDNVASAEV